MRVERRIWFPDKYDLAIVTTLTSLGGGVDRTMLACRASVAGADLRARLNWLERFGYLRREQGRRARYTAIRMPRPGDEHAIDEYAAAATP